MKSFSPLRSLKGTASRKRWSIGSNWRHRCRSSHHTVRSARLLVPCSARCPRHQTSSESDQSSFGSWRQADSIIPLFKKQDIDRNWHLEGITFARPKSPIFTWTKRHVLLSSLCILLTGALLWSFKGRSIPTKICLFASIDSLEPATVWHNLVECWLLFKHMNT